MTLQERVDKFIEWWCQDDQGAEPDLLSLLQSVRDDAYLSGRCEALAEAIKMVDEWDVLRTDDNCHVSPDVIADEIRELRSQPGPKPKEEEVKP